MRRAPGLTLGWSTPSRESSVVVLSRGCTGEALPRGGGNDDGALGKSHQGLTLVLTPRAVAWGVHHGRAGIGSRPCKPRKVGVAAAASGALQLNSQQETVSWALRFLCFLARIPGLCRWPPFRAEPQRQVGRVEDSHHGHQSWKRWRRDGLPESSNLGAPARVAACRATRHQGVDKSHTQ